jgi:hypothetical protein
MMGKSAFFSEGTAGQMKSAPSFAKDDDSSLPKELNGSKIGLGPKPIWGMSVRIHGGFTLWKRKPKPKPNKMKNCGGHY